MPPSRIEVPLHQMMCIAGEENVPHDGTANHDSHQRNDTQETACHKHGAALKTQQRQGLHMLHRNERCNKTLRPSS